MIEPMNTEALTLPALIAVLAVAAVHAAEPVVTRAIALEDFQIHTNDQQLAQAWSTSSLESPPPTR
jgi:hypothetical protein